MTMVEPTFFVIPVVVASVLVLVAYLVRANAANAANGTTASDGSSKPAAPTNYFVIFCVGLLLGIGAAYLFGGGKKESLQNVMREIDLGEPKF